MDPNSLLGIDMSRCTRGAVSWQTAIDATSQAILRDVADYLGTRDVAAWQAVNVETTNVFDACYEDGSVWQNCAQSQFPQFFADDELYEGDHRPRLLRCHALLLRANYAPGCLLYIKSMEEVAFLEGQLRKALAFCEAYHAACGRDAHLLVGHFQLMRSATGTRFEFGVEGLEGVPLIAGLPAGVLKMKLFLDGSNLFTCAEYAEGRGFPFQPYTQSKHKQLTLNIWSGSLGIDLCYSGVPLTLDGARRSSTSSHGTNASIPCGTDPVLCVLTLVEDDATMQSSLLKVQLPSGS
eukprot:TRINITY_DN23283_c0_g1_i1.p1 TRINITY_DN23283_c0_g1~~TRINITY_DN23283_c0_g1_i1.p1  ORF type:complete len:328 (+),score=29.51 TRINITY_DN23283_c0_g1_i1:105-986(+)